MTPVLEFYADWADLDLFGHMNNVAYFRYVQAARINFCSRSGFGVLNEPQRPGFMVAECNCKFSKPLKLGEKFLVSTTLNWARNSSFRIDHVFTSAEGVLIAEAFDVLVCFDHAANAKMQIPESMKTLWGNQETARDK
jgi:acyl-CoA thioester hydrolase